MLKALQRISRKQCGKIPALSDQVSLFLVFFFFPFSNSIEWFLNIYKWTEGLGGSVFLCVCVCVCVCLLKSETLSSFLCSVCVLRRTMYIHVGIEQL